jgi:hypothetical protein
MAMSFLSQPFPQTTIEATRNLRIEGLLSYHSTVGYFEWYSLDGNNKGLIVFKAADGTTLDLGFVRTVCQHMSFRTVALQATEVETSTHPPSSALPAGEGKADKLN